MLAGMVQSDVTLGEVLALFEVPRDILQTEELDDGVLVHLFGLAADLDDKGDIVQIIEAPKSPITVSCSDEQVMGFFTFAAAKAGLEVRLRYFIRGSSGMFSVHLFKREAITAQ